VFLSPNSLPFWEWENVFRDPVDVAAGTDTLVVHSEFWY
jgi:hypothetical protein